MNDALKKAIRKAFQDLLCCDRDLFNWPDELSLNHGDLNCQKCSHARKLHKVCINHRLANHLENHISEDRELIDDRLKNRWYVDIEFNRIGEVVKELNEKLVRPDIIVHNRQSGFNKFNFLVVECKKTAGKSTKLIDSDKEKINNFMTATEYSYEFGLMVIYEEEGIKATFYFKDAGGEIIGEPIIAVPPEKGRVG